MTRTVIDNDARPPNRRFTVPVTNDQVEDLLKSAKLSQENLDERGRSGIRKTFAKLFHSKAFHIAVVVLCCLDGLLVLCMLLMEIEVLKLKSGVLRSRLVTVQFAFECISVSIVSLFLVEILFKLWLFGLKFYRRHWLEVVDAVVCVVSFAVDIYNIVRHTQHSQGHAGKSDSVHTDATAHHDAGVKESEYETVQNTLADAAGLLVLFRLWRVIRIVNAIIISVATSHEGTVEKLKNHIASAEERIQQLEHLILSHGIPLPPGPSKDRSA